MKITIINGTNRIGNKSMGVSQAVKQIVQKKDIHSSIVSLNNFTELFRGKYIDVHNATVSQKKDILHMAAADMLLFVVPSYHHGIPAALKNFLDILDCDDAFNNKVIGFIAANKTRAHGAEQAIEVVNGILSYKKLNSFIVPRVNITDYDIIDTERLQEYIDYCLTFFRTAHKDSSARLYC